MKGPFNVIYLPEAQEFLLSLPKRVMQKIVYNVNKCRTIPNSKLFCKMKDTEIWEFRTDFEGNIYRLYAFWDTRAGAYVIVTHGVQKKWQKADRRDIKKAEKVRVESLSNSDCSYLYN